MDFQSVSSGRLAFVMAHRNTTGRRDLVLLKRVIGQLFNQTDDHWKLIVVDDQSTYRPAIHYLEDLHNQAPDRVSLLRLNERVGPGMARNQGILLAARNGCPVIMFCDSDDLVHSERVSRTRKAFQSTQAPTVLYSGFVAVDSNGTALKRDEITPSLLEILDAIAHKPPTGMDVWKHIGTRSGYINLTSATSVSTSTALLNPFPAESVSEDSHTWMRYSAAGAEYIFDESIPVSYRTCRDGGGSASRERDGAQFYYDKARVDIDGFEQAIMLSERRGTTDRKTESNTLLAAFYLRLAQTMLNENMTDLTAELVSKAQSIDAQTCAVEISRYPDLDRLIYGEADWKKAA